VALILRAAERVAVPWKNGGGLTREVASDPPGSTLGSFDWRMSVAEVRSGGPFSAFPGIDRKLAVLDGRLRLSIEGRAAATLSAESPPVAFAGEAPAFGEPLQSPVTDLNLMSRRDRYHSRLTRGTGRECVPLSLTAATTLIIALTELTVRLEEGEARLLAFDAARLEGAARCEVLLAPEAHGHPQPPFYLAEIFATER
jgi:uncharacterized protein